MLSGNRRGAPTRQAIDPPGREGGTLGRLFTDESPRFHSYDVEQKRLSYQYREDPRVGAVQPEEGVSY